jgi:hypothetical protein
MMTAIGCMVQYANEEFRRAKNHQPGEARETNEALLHVPSRTELMHTANSMASKLVPRK